MLETKNNRIDIQKLDSQVRWDAQKYAHLWEGADSLQPFGAKPDEQLADGLPDSIAAAAAVSNIESPNYTMQRYSAPARWLAKFSAKVVLYLGRIITHPQTHFNYNVVSGLNKVNQRLEQIGDRSRQQAGIIGWLAQALPRLDDQMASVECRLTQSDKERIDHGRELEYTRVRLPKIESKVDCTHAEFGEKILQMEDDLAQLRARLSLQERQMQKTGQQPAHSADDSIERSKPATSAVNATGDLDGLYMVFEDRFRGAREDILNRLDNYFPAVQECLAEVPEKAAIIDLGCGRGEWLELLANRGISARGIDINVGFLAQCEQSGFDVIESDALEYLVSLPDQSVSIVTGFHIIEHMEFSFLVRLIDEVLRVLQPRGMAIFETPNPKNLIVGACNFYADPTHVRQIFPELLQFVMRSRGFREAQLRYMNPHSKEQQLDEREAPILAAQLNGLLSCARDFSVVAHK